MSLLGRSDLDARSWIRSIQASAKTILVCLSGFFLSWLVLRVLVFQLDQDLMLAIYNGGSEPTVALLAWVIASIGNAVWMPLVVWLYVFRSNRYGWTSAIHLAVAIILSMVLVDLLKMLFGLPRPPEVLNVQYRFGIPTNDAFPSGHTSRAFTVAAVVWVRYAKWRIPFVALAAATGISMMVIGRHFPSDVLGGAFVGIILGTFVVNLAKVRPD